MTKISATVNEAAALTGMSRSALYRLVAEGKLAIRKNGKRSLFLVEDLDRFVRSLPISA